MSSAGAVLNCSICSLLILLFSSRTMQPDHHLQQDWHQKHLEIHDKYPEKFGPEILTEKNHNFQTLPTYYGNVCLRFIPVFDIVVHRSPEYLLCRRKD